MSRSTLRRLWEGEPPADAAPSNDSGRANLPLRRSIIRLGRSLALPESRKAISWLNRTASYQTTRTGIVLFRKMRKSFLVGLLARAPWSVPIETLAGALGYWGSAPWSMLVETLASAF